MTRVIAAAILVGVAFATAGGTAGAAFRGANGKLAFARGGDIWVADPDGSNATQLTEGPALDRSPRWSPDGTRLAFSSDRDGDAEIFVMNADGSGLRQLTFNSVARDRISAWTADGTQIVYDKEFAEIYVVNADGTGGERKVADGATPGSAPHGGRIVFSNAGLTTVNLDGSGQRQVTTGPDLSANWSPSANDLVFTRAGETDRDVYRIHVSGNDLVRLTDTPGRTEFAPVWSPDGTKVAFVGCVGAECQVYVMGADGNGESQVTTFGVMGGEGSVDWQPVPRHERVGTRMSLFGGPSQTLLSGEPFHVSHGWGLAADTTGHNALGKYGFSLTVDGVEVASNFVDKFHEEVPDVGLVQNRTWVFNFAAGMTGTHTFTGRWFAPCQACEKPNAVVTALEQTVTVTFVS